MSEFQSSYGLEEFIGYEELESACMDYILNSELPLLADCYDYKSTCFASMGNTAFNCWNISKNVPAVIFLIQPIQQGIRSLRVLYSQVVDPYGLTLS